MTNYFYKNILINLRGADHGDYWNGAPKNKRWAKISNATVARMAAV